MDVLIKQKEYQMISATNVGERTSATAGAVIGGDEGL